MIYTLTLNPAIDLFIETNQLQPNIVNRTNRYDVQANGKGVNVSLILQMLGIKNCAWGIGSGFTADYIVQYLRAKGISTTFLKSTGITRINVFTHVLQGPTEYKLVNPGPRVPQAVVQQLIEQIQGLDAQDYLVISGSFAHGISPDILEKIAKIAFETGFYLAIDTSYREILQTLKYHPIVIKPDEEEILSWFGVTDKPDLAGYCTLCQRLVELGAEGVLLSLGAEGALYVDSQEQLFGNAPQGQVVNTACAGDTMLGTFLAGKLRKHDLRATLAKSIAAGSSTAFTAGLTDFSDVDLLTKQVQIREI